MIDWLSHDHAQKEPALVVPSSAVVHVGENGSIELSPEALKHYGLEPGAEVRIDFAEDHLRLRRSVERLARVYIEPTSKCNLSCRTCIRNNWDEPLGNMDEATFSRILEQLGDMPKPLSIFFGGYRRAALPPPHRRHGSPGEADRRSG